MLMLTHTLLVRRKRTYAVRRDQREAHDEPEQPKPIEGCGGVWGGGGVVGLGGMSLLTCGG